MIQKFILGLGGFSLWIYALIMHVFFSKNNRTDIGYYLFEEFDTTNKSGMNIHKLRFVLGICTFIFILFVIDYLD